MKKDFVNSGAKLLSTLLLIFFCFVGFSELSAQSLNTVANASSSSTFDVDLNQYSFIDDLSAANLFKAEAYDVLGRIQNNPDDSDMSLEMVRKDLYKALYHNISNGNSTQDSFERVIPRLYSSASMNMPNGVSANALRQLYMDAITLAIQ